MRFKIGDYVKVVDGFTPEKTSEPVSWQGQIKELPEREGDEYLMELDAQTLDSLTDKHLLNCIFHGWDKLYYLMEGKDLVPASCRDSPAMREAANQKFNQRLEEQEKDDLYSMPEMNKALLKEWQDAFQECPEFRNLPDHQKVMAVDAIFTFSLLAFDIEDTDVGDWTTDTVRSVCLDWVVKRIPEKPEYFEVFGTAVTDFFVFLDRERLMEGAGALAAEAAKIAPESLKRALNPNNWSPAKATLMRSRTYMTPKKEGGKAFARHKTAAQTPYPSQWEPPTVDPFRNYTGSSLVKVQYPDGRLVKCKFSKVEADLRAGRCTVVKKK